MSQKTPTTLPIAPAVYDYVNEEITRDQLVKSIQFLEREVFLLMGMKHG